MDWPTRRLDMTPFTGAKTRLNTTFTQPYFRICLSLASPGLYQGVFTHLGFRLPFWMRLWETCCVNSEKWLIIDEWKIPDLVRFLSPIIFYYVTNEQLESYEEDHMTKLYSRVLILQRFLSKMWLTEHRFCRLHLFVRDVGVDRGVVSRGRTFAPTWFQRRLSSRQIRPRRYSQVSRWSRSIWCAFMYETRGQLTHNTPGVLILLVQLLRTITDVNGSSNIDRTLIRTEEGPKV